MAIEITKYKQYEKNTLKAFVDIKMSSIGLEIRECTLHEANGKRWIGLPAKPYQKDGKTQYSYIVAFPEKRCWSAFQKAALDALDTYRRDCR